MTSPDERPLLALALLLSGIAVTDVAFRVSQVAVPLVVLGATGSPVASGLAAGATGLPLLLSPWWARRPRAWVTTGPRLAVLYLGEAASLALVPLAASTGRLDAAVLLLSGLALGAVEAVSGPARDALLADLAERTDRSRGPGATRDRALVALTAREAVRRVAMLAGPALGGVAVAAGRGVAVLWLEVVVVVASAALALVAPVPSGVCAADEAAPRTWPVVRARPEVLAGWVVRGTGCAAWFGFTLGLAVVGHDQGRAGLLVAAGLSAYGLGALVGTALTLPVLRRVPVLPTQCLAWAATGTAWVAMGTAPRLGVVVAGAVVAGIAVPLGNGGVTASITRTSRGAERRTLLAGQSMVVGVAGSAGLLAGGAVIAALGGAATLVVTGVVTAAVATAVLGASLASGGTRRLHREHRAGRVEEDPLGVAAQDQLAHR